MHDGSRPQLSVLVPVFRPDPALLRPALESVLAQDHPAFEVVVVEDPSPTEGGGVVAALGDPRVRYHRNPGRTGLTAQLNRGIALCRADWVARMDADDLCAPNRLSRQASFVAAHPDVSVVGSNLEVIDAQGGVLGERRYPETHEAVAAALGSYCPVAHPSVLFRKAHVEAAGGYRAEAPVEDYDLWIRLFLSGRRFHNLQQPLLRYRVHGQAGKVASLRRQLRATVQLKARRLRGRAGVWGVRHEARLWAERALLLAPPRLVLWLFLRVAVRPLRPAARP